MLEKEIMIKYTAKDFIIYENATHDEGEMALVNIAEGKHIIYNGDWYHSKTSARIEGYLHAFGIDVRDVRTIELTPKSLEFKELYFYDGSEDY